MFRLMPVCLLALLVACGEAPPTAPSPPPPDHAPTTETGVSAADIAVPENAPAAQASSIDPTELAMALTQLTQTVRRYALEQRRAPQTLDELVTAGYLTRVPAAPPGKKFAVDKNLQVYLADR